MSILVEILAKNINCSVIISGRFLNISVYLLLDKLIENGNILYYNSDFDPEGLLIVAKLKEKYYDSLNLFCYEKDAHKVCISKKEISDFRLNKLEKIDIHKLKEMKDILSNTRLVAYQENNENVLLNIF